MSDEQSQERTHEATPKRKQEAKEKGQIARSKELTTAIVMLVSSAMLFFYGGVIVDEMIGLLKEFFTLTREEIYDKHMLIFAVVSACTKALLVLLPFFIIVVLSALGGGVLIGGFNFSGQSLQPKLERIDPIKGIKRIFSLKSLMELVKALAKFLLILAFGLTVLWIQAPKIMSINNVDILTAIGNSSSILLWSFIFISSALIIIALIDVPFQIMQHDKQIKMTTQEIKDEMKNTEGNPEVKSKIRQLQQQAAQNRMMSDVPKADVVITNPTHYSVAVKYDRQGGGAPLVVAKGADQIAFYIQKVARANDVELLEAPPLARSLYNTTEIGDEIPSGLYIAVAQVLAYVYQLRRFKRRSGKRPRPLGDLPIPEDLRY